MAREVWIGIEMVKDDPIVRGVFSKKVRALHAGGKKMFALPVRVNQILPNDFMKNLEQTDADL